MGPSVTRVVKFLRRGASVSRADVEYAKSSSNTTAPTSGWQTTAPAWENGKYIWTRTHTFYDDGSSTYSIPVCLPSGKGISSIVEQYYLSDSATEQIGGSWSATAPTWQDGKYIWTRSLITYTDNSTVTTSPVCATGHKGDKGDTGVGISSITEYYLATSASSGVTRSTSGWTTTIQSLTSSNKYLWNYEEITYSNNSKAYTDPHIIGVYGDTGSPGSPGGTGVGISSITEYYLATSASSGVTRSTSGWTTTVQSTTSTNKYLWNYEKITYTNNTTAYTDPRIIGTYGDTGQKGDDSVVYTLRPNYPALLFHSDGNSAAYTPASFTLRCGYIKTVGDVRTVYDYPSGGTFGSYNLLYRIIQADGTPVATFAGDQPYGWDWIDNNNTGEFKDGNGNLVVPSSTNRIAIDFAVTKQAPRTCNDTTDVLAIIRVPIYKLSDGDKGDKGDTGSRGPALRGPQAWNDLPSNYHFQAGAEGQTYLDVVLYNGYYYLCTKAHNKAPSNYPGSSQDQIYHYWQLGDSVDLIATKVLLAANAVINFAQTNQILVMKSDGTTVALGLGGGSYPLWIGAPTAANASFKVDIDGKLVATGAEIGGKISAQSLTMPFEAVEGVTHTYALDDPCNIVLSMYGGGSTVTLSLPDNNSAFNGRRVIVSWPPMRTAMEANHAITGRIRCPNKDAGSAFYSSYFASRIESWAGGIAEFICIDSTWWLLNIESNGVQYTQYS